MNQDLMKQAGIDYDEGLSRFAGQKAIYEKYLKRFPQEKTFENLCQAMENQDYEQAFRDAHSMKGVSGNMSMNGLYQELQPFVELLRNGKDIPAAVAAFPALKAKYDQTLQALETLD